MNRSKRNKGEVIATIAVLTVFFIYVAILIAPYVTGNLWSTLSGFSAAFLHPFHLRLCAMTGKTILFFLFVEVLIICCVSTIAIKNERPGSEHGSARLKAPSEVCPFVADKTFENNRILTKNLRISVLKPLSTLRSLNTLVVGGMGAGKSYYTLIPNILQANTSFVVTDPSKELVKKTGWFLKNKAGYNVKVLDLENPEGSLKYNFFRYLESEDDCLRIVNIIFEATVDSKSAEPRGSSDPMWENMAKAWLLALVLLLYYRGTKDEQNVETLVYLLDEDYLKENDSGGRVETPVSALFKVLDVDLPGNMATRNYMSATDGAVVTIRGVKSTLRSRIGKFLLPSIQELMKRDELDLSSIGTEKTALFLAVPSEDSSFNFIISMVYAQLFPALYRLARQQPNNKLPVPVQFLNDEQKNFIMPKDFVTYLTTGRKFEMTFMMFYQEMQQIEAQFPQEYETLIGTCTTFLYLGGSGHETNKKISEMIGSETLHSYSYNRSYGAHGSYSRNESLSARKVLEADEVDTVLRGDEALCYVKGFGWCLDKKNVTENHPNFKYLSGQPEGDVLDWGGNDAVSSTITLGMKTSEKMQKVAYTIDIDRIEAAKIKELYKIRIYGED